MFDKPTSIIIQTCYITIFLVNGILSITKANIMQIINIAIDNNITDNTGLNDNTDIPKFIRKCCNTKGCIKYVNNVYFEIF